MFKSINKRYNWLTKVHFDKPTGFYYYTRGGNKVFIRHPRHYLPIKEDMWTCENLFFHYYLPKDGDQVVALGAGYGEDAIFLKQKSPDVKYLGVEAQPVIYECLANTFRELGDGFKASPYVISNEKNIKFCSHLLKTRLQCVATPDPCWNSWVFFVNHYYYCICLYFSNRV